MDSRKLIAAIAALLLSPEFASADAGDGIENRLDARGDRIEQRLSEKGDADGRAGRTVRAESRRVVHEVNTDLESGAVPGALAKLHRRHRFDDDQLTILLLLLQRRIQEADRDGPGRHGPQQSGEIRPLDLKAGDQVLFGKYSGTEVKIEGEEYLIMREDDVLGIID